MDIMGLAILDEYWDIKSANDKFFDFVGGTEFQSVAKLIKDGQLDNFFQMFKDLESCDVSSGVFDMLNFNGNYYPVYLKVKYKDKDKKYYEMKLWDIIKSEESFSEISLKEKKLRNFLTICNDISFEYFPKSDNFKLFMFNGLNEIIIYNDTLSKWENDAVNDEYIESNSVIQFKRFCSDLKADKLQTEYYFKSSFFSNGAKMQNIRCYCGRNTEDFKLECTVGIIRAYGDDSLQNESILFSKTSRDFLTGVLNKMSIKKYCEDKIMENPQFKMCMVIIDVDNFKDVNDNFGHLYGDKVLVKVAEIITGYVGEHGTVGRFGGDEFFVLFENIRNLLELRGILRAIRSSVQSEFEGKLKNVKITLSIGVSTYPDDGTTYADLFKIADKALYIAKEKGKNRYVIYNREVHGDFIVGQNNQISVGLGRGARDYTKFMVHIIPRILDKNNCDFNSILNDMKKKFLLDRINIYYGDNLKLTYSSEENFDSNISALCFKNSNYLLKFEQSNEFIVNHIDILGVSFKDVHLFFDNDNVLSVVQCLIGDAENFRGLITFEKIGAFKKWAIEETKDFAILASVISGVL